MISGFALSGGLGLGLAVVVAAAVIALVLARRLIAFGVFVLRLGGLCLAALIFGRLSVRGLLLLDVCRDLYGAALAAP